MANVLRCHRRHAGRRLRVSFRDQRGIRHAVEVEAESLYEAAVLGIRLLNRDPWVEKIGPATVLEIEVREPSTRHAISLQQVERWLAGATTNPNEASKKAKLKSLALTRAVQKREATQAAMRRAVKRFNEKKAEAQQQEGAE